MIPVSYLPHSWRETLPVDPKTEDIGISFETPGKDIVRLRLNKANADYLFDSLYEAKKAAVCATKPPTASEIRKSSNPSPEEIKKTFIMAISSLIDEASNGDFKLMMKLEDLARNILVLIDGCTDIPPVFLAIGAYTCDIISSELHHDIISFRMGKDPIRMEAHRERCKQRRLEASKQKEIEAMAGNVQ